MHQTDYKFLTYFFSIIPGGGHMYLGLMKRGLQIMLGFFGIIALTNIISFAEPLIFFCVLIWFFGIFDVRQYAHKKLNNQPYKDEVVFDVHLNTVNKKLVGFVIIAFGGFVLFDNSMDLIKFFDVEYRIINMIKESILGLGLIGLGLYLLKLHSNRKEVLQIEDKLR